MTTALLMIDIQNDYFPGGRMELEGSSEAAEQARMVLDLFRQKKWPLIHIQHLSARPGAPFFIPGTEGVEIHSTLCPLPEERVIQKFFPNSFRKTLLLEHLQEEKINHLVITGMMTHMCVEATTRAAFDYGFKCTVLHDACATRSLSFGGETVPVRQVQAVSLATLAAVYAKVVSTRDYLSGLG